MPSIIPSYMYTLFASLIVGSIVICACGLSTLSVKNEAKQQQLANIAEYIATESLELTSRAKADNLTATLSLTLPPSIGDQRYWIQIKNDSSRAWVEAGFGTTPTVNQQRAYIPTEVFASGTYTSGLGAAKLECYSDGSGVYLTLSGGS
ncbi:MAG: hypothetical protein NWE99_05765 [Candidatus Bathyarchaeota archaeon]|nr:hypothetical protein [Candidatus Bathyarchaeota archaeon]